MSLSQVLSHDAHCRDPARVSVVERCLTSIGKVPDRFAAATSVYLSKNSLTTLGGIQQFSDVRVLSLSNNLVADLEEIRVLQSCPHLRVLNLQENPVAWLPYYRWHALQMLPEVGSASIRDVASSKALPVPHPISRMLQGVVSLRRSFQLEYLVSLDLGLLFILSRPPPPPVASRAEAIAK